MENKYKYIKDKLLNVLSLIFLSNVIFKLAPRLNFMPRNLRKLRQIRDYIYVFCKKEYVTMQCIVIPDMYKCE